MHKLMSGRLRKQPNRSLCYILLQLPRSEVPAGLNASASLPAFESS